VIHGYMSLAHRVITRIIVIEWYIISLGFVIAFSVVVGCWYLHLEVERMCR